MAWEPPLAPMPPPPPDEPEPIPEEPAPEPIPLPPKLKPTIVLEPKSNIFTVILDFIRRLFN